MLLARSADSSKNVPAQSYKDHIEGVLTLARNFAECCGQFSKTDQELLCEVVEIAAELHDIGKLDHENQKFLKNPVGSKKLPIQHTDAGTALLLLKECLLGAILVKSHHIGLPDFSELADLGYLRDKDIKEYVDEDLDKLISKHEEALGKKCIVKLCQNMIKDDPAMFFRMALSCLIDADHTNSSNHYQEITICNSIELNALKRLESLDRYVDSLKGKDDRSRLRTQVYEAARNNQFGKSIIACSSPVGTGKTTAVMAHLLNASAKRNLRRIFIVLPFTNIITQMVHVLRKSVVLDGENPEEVIAEVHHRVDFEDATIRHLSTLWKAPIIVTTSVAFFETIASNRTSVLRRLNSLPGSAIFLDESHAMLPVKLLSLSWDWIKKLANYWNCYWVLASGSLQEFWKDEKIDDNPPNVPEIIDSDLLARLSIFEYARISYKFEPEEKNLVEIASLLRDMPGPRIVILNTVQSAAVIAKYVFDADGRAKVEHISNSLTPEDRESTLKKIKNRLNDKNDTDWTLIATSSIEAGVDLSFRSGIRELGSLTSLLQIAGRVNRHGIYEDAIVCTIKLKEADNLIRHPYLEASAQVLENYFLSNIPIASELATDALMKEIRIKGITNLSEQLKRFEKSLAFPKIDENFKVISNDTRIVIVDNCLIERLQRNEKVDWKEIIRKSVQIWGYKLDELHITPIANKDGLYGWNMSYDDFLGYMAGVIDYKFKETCFV